MTTRKMPPSRLFPRLHIRWEGAFWKVVSSLCFAGIAAIVKYVTLHPENQGVQVTQVIFCENALGTLFILLPQLSTFDLRPQLRRYDLHAIRIGSAIIGLLCWAQSLYYLPLSLAIALSFIGPVLTLIVARIFLKEALTPLRLCAIVIGLIGAALIIRPDKKFLSGITVFDHSPLLLLLPIASALGLAGTKVAGRAMSLKGESPRILSTYLLLFMVPITGVLAISAWAPMTSLQIKLVILSGLLTALAHWSVARSYMCASIPFLTPFGFVRIFVGASLGFILFQEHTPHDTFYYGVAAILASVLLLTFTPNDTPKDPPKEEGGGLKKPQS